MCLALIPGLTFAPVCIYQFWQLGSYIYRGRHIITELIFDIGQGVIFIIVSFGTVDEECDRSGKLFQLKMQELTLLLINQMNKYIYIVYNINN